MLRRIAGSVGFALGALGEAGEPAALPQRADAALALLAGDGPPVRLVSMSCVEAFERQDRDWQRAVLPPDLPVVVVEAGATRGWWRYTGCGAPV